ncbi:hypothetical protein [Rhizobium sp. TRM95796]|uniref:hypothetical protein n=1 Tax=Rhizobium sp. TRM95796 TaxID=2979862 RepID=UPI0021E9AA43|nr:hypothetical protein [Rhizobium sp. TRM95796]MCV3769071.1 hypothetical protein [Rhizobium sp. TRM95796]
MKIFGDESDEFIFGTSKSDFIVPRAGRDVVYGRKGNDTIMDTANEANGPRWSQDDVFFGGYGNDILITTSGHDVLAGGRGNDHIYAQSLDSFAAQGGTGFDVLHLIEGTTYTQKRVDGILELHLVSDEVSQTIYARGIEDIRYDAPFAL